MAGESWYKEMSVYQIWIRSFRDGNGDGIGDLLGVLEKLDYIKSLGVDAVLFSPVFPSPNADYGTDTSDFINIAPEYGDLDTFRRVLDEAHRRGLRLFLELAINHTADEHFWFRESRKSVSNPYHDYYCWRSAKYFGKKRLSPEGFASRADGQSWVYNGDLDEYYLSLFTGKQPVLNLDNPKVRAEIKKILRFWLDMGVDGFREDVITYFSKALFSSDRFPKLPVMLGKARPSALDNTLRELKRDVLNCYDCFAVGEIPGISADEALKSISEGPDKVLDEIMIFDGRQGPSDLSSMLSSPFSLKKMKAAFTERQVKAEGRGWNVLCLEDHSCPRSISRFGSEIYRKESGKMLAAAVFLQKGTPFLYQGQEIGMLNTALPRLEMYRDALTFHTAENAAKIVSKGKVLELVHRFSRDNARTPMQWSSGKNAGFSSGTPWFGVNPNYMEINAAAEEKDPDSILNFYRRLLALRKENKAAVCGVYRELLPGDKQLYVYERVYGREKLLVICSFTNEQVRFEASDGYSIEEEEPVLSNYEHNFVISNGFTTRPYEMRVYHFK